MLGTYGILPTTSGKDDWTEVQRFDIAQAGIALRDDPRLRFGFQELTRLAEAPGLSFHERFSSWLGR
jgi:hypothetical protein